MQLNNNVTQIIHDKIEFKDTLLWVKLPSFQILSESTFKYKLVRCSTCLDKFQFSFFTSDIHLKKKL